MTSESTGIASTYDDNDIVNPSSNTHFESVLAARLKRRTVLGGGITATTGALLGSISLTACGGDGSGNTPAGNGPATPPNKLALGFKPVAKNLLDQVTVPDGYQISILHALGDPLHFGDTSWSDTGNEAADSYARRVGDGHDGMYFFGLGENGGFKQQVSDRGLLCVNHEYVVSPYVMHANGRTPGATRVAAEVDKEIQAHGVSVVEVKRKSNSTDMEMVRGSKFNRRITSDTPMQFGGPVRGNALVQTKLSPSGEQAFGTNNNCACGYTPWGTYLTCEENYLNVLARADGDDNQRTAVEIAALKRYGLPANRKSPYLWDTAGTSDTYARWNSRVSAAKATEDFRNVFNTFGWVVEIDPFAPDAAPVKRSYLGRFNHEGAWPAPAKTGEPIVIYSGDDARNEYIYKFVSAEKWNPADVGGGYKAGAKYLDKGTLYVAKFKADGTGEWLELTFGKNGLDHINPKYPFASQADVLIHARLAADFLGATKMDRPEWGAVNPLNNEVYMTLTNNSNRIDPASTPSGSQLVPDAANPRYYNDGEGNKGNPNGHIIRWRENGSQAATAFAWDIYLFGAENDAAANVNLSGLTDVNDFSSPDGLYFDHRGMLWIQTDDGAYTDVTNCMMLAAVPGKVGDGKKEVVAAGGTKTIVGAQATPDTVRRFLTGPVQCEITGVLVTPDGKTLMFNVQHPGEDGKLTAPTSAWPGNQMGTGQKRPRSATVVVSRKDGGPIGL